eukprot:765032-Hanusia_phi.AAC.2
MSESRSQQQSAQSSQRSTPRSLQFTPRAVQGAVQGAGKLRLPFSADRTRANSFEEAMRQFKSDPHCNAEFTAGDSETIRSGDEPGERACLLLEAKVTKGRRESPRQRRG